MTTTEDARPATGVSTAQGQTPLPLERLLHSANCGLLIHRVGMFEYDMAHEGRQFSVDLLGYMNEAQAGIATTFAYKEVFGVRERMHWLIHLKSPDQYGKLLEMVENDRAYRRISEADDRIAEEKGGGNWERMFVPGSLQEQVLVPQHGYSEEHPPDTFVPPAAGQTSQPPELRLNSATAGAIVLKTADVKYELREEGRAFLYAWAQEVNRELAGRATALVYEQTWGRQDRVHCLVHLRTQEDYTAVVEIDRGERMAVEVYGKDWVPVRKGGGGWGGMFVPASMTDLLLLPAAATPAAEDGS